MIESAERFLRLRQVAERVALSPASIYEAMAAGRFPKPYHLGKLTKRSKKENGHSVRWLSTEIDGWIRERTGRGAAR